MLPLFSVGGSLSSALAMGLVGGYPVGAASVSGIYKSNACTKEEAERALAFCNNCGPAFILGVIGNGIFSSASVGISLFLIHIASALTVGFIFKVLRPVKRIGAFKTTLHYGNISFSKCFTEAVSSSAKSTLLISAYIVFFSVFLCVMEKFKIIQGAALLLSSFAGLDPKTVQAVLSGFLEMTVGIFALSKQADFEPMFILTSFLLGWGGLSVHFQTLSVISVSGLSTKQYYAGKFLQGIISTVFSFIWLKSVQRPHSPVFPSHIISGTKASLPFILFLVLTILIFLFCKKRWKKEK